MASQPNSRPIWRGYLRLALVSCPVALHNVLRGGEGLHFHLINPKTGHRIRMITIDAETEQEVSRRELVKGYEFEKDHYLLLEDKDFEEARVESSSTLRIAKFVEAASIDPVYFDTSYYLAPDGDAGEDVFVVLRDAIRKAGVAALSRVVISQRERPVAILPWGRGMICHTLHEPRDLRDADPLWEELEGERPDAAMVDLARQLIARQQGRFEPEDTEDRYESKLRDVIAARLKGEGITPEAEPEDRGDNVVDLMAALKASLAEGKPPRAKAKAPASRKRTRRKAS
ncbi:MAG TPA: Ku protein [Rhodopila sp.]|uniref:non-homologous end joining protein Ku n=1 Tax=Rhodopila sp. TaxID=2480087 RepID=UPI002B961017|nr:Ku protein [Rhodopila sp.]HVY15387.1 Ku protein [Rhodopila sp.]